MLVAGAPVKLIYLYVFYCNNLWKTIGAYLWVISWLHSRKVSNNRARYPLDRHLKCVQKYVHMDSIDQD